MKKVAEIIKLLQNTSGTNDKISILKANKDNDLLKKVILYTYSPYLKYGIAEKKYKDITVTRFHKCEGIESIFDLLDLLATSNINDNLRGTAKKFIEQQDEELKELYKLMLFKDLKVGANAKTFNKAWKDLVPLFQVQLAESFGKEDIPQGAEFYVTTKIDGFRVVSIPNEQGEYTAYTRKGEKYEGIEHILEEAKIIGQGKYVLDGELIVRNDDNLSSGDLYNLTTKIARKKGKTKDKERLQFHLFDIIYIDEFKRGEGSLPYSKRREMIEELFETFGNQVNNFVNVEVLYKGKDQEQVSVLANELTEDGYEGAMVNLANAKYLCKRHAGVLKVKEFKEADVYVKGVYEGTKQNVGRLGGVVIQYLHEGELYECECGSGFTKEHRIEFWQNPELIIGKVIEVQFFETTTNKKGGVGLRFPTWHHRIREDKSFEDITDVATV